MQKGPSEIAVVQISRTEYIPKCYRNMIDPIPQKPISHPRNQVGDPIKRHTDLFKYGYIPHV